MDPRQTWAWEDERIRVSAKHSTPLCLARQLIRMSAGGFLWPLGNFAERHFADVASGRLRLTGNFLSKSCDWHGCGDVCQPSALLDAPFGTAERTNATFDAFRMAQVNFSAWGYLFFCLLEPAGIFPSGFTP